MKMMIEVDIPNGRSVAEAEMAVKMVFNPDWMAEWWHIDDIQSFHDYDEDDPERLSDDEAREVLRLMEKYHNCEVGINWDVIDNWIDHVKDQREAV
jgi:hypothetical protein